MQDARQRKFNIVVFWKVDRLGRSVSHMTQIVEEWKNLGINFVVTTLGMDTSTPTGECIFGIMAQVAQLERALGIERTKLSIERKKKSIAEKGYYVNSKGEKRTSLGRPKGSKDKDQKGRAKAGYYVGWVKRKKVNNLLINK